MRLIVIIISILAFLIIWGIATWKIECRNNRLCRYKSEGDFEIANLGSTYAYYDFDYHLVGLRGMNLANVPQYLDCDQIIFDNFKKCLTKGSKIVICLPDFVFCGKCTDMKRKVYYEALTHNKIQDYDFKFFIGLLLKSMTEPFTHKYRNNRNKWKGHKATHDEKVRHANGRINDWENGIGIGDVSFGSLNPQLTDTIKINKKRVIDLINEAESESVVPVLIVPPVSDIIRARVSHECLDTYLYQPIREIQRETGARLFDYMYDEKLGDEKLYLNSDCLNEDGKRIFMKKIIDDLSSIDE